MHAAFAHADDEDGVLAHGEDGLKNELGNFAFDLSSVLNPEDMIRPEALENRVVNRDRWSAPFFIWIAVEATGFTSRGRAKCLAQMCAHSLIGLQRILGL
jgi:hypothetical protein